MLKAIKFIGSVVGWAIFFAFLAVVVHRILPSMKRPNDRGERAEREVVVASEDQGAATLFEDSVKVEPTVSAAAPAFDESVVVVKPASTKEEDQTEKLRIEEQKRNADAKKFESDALAAYDLGNYDKAISSMERSEKRSKCFAWVMRSCCK